MSLISGSASALCLRGAFPASQPDVVAALALWCSNYSVPLTKNLRLFCLTSVHPPVLGRVNQLNMVRSAAVMSSAFVMNMLSGRLMQRLVNKPMNSSQNTVNSNETVAIGIFRSCPNPAIAIGNEACVQSHEQRMSEHGRSIQVPGFKVKSVEDESPADVSATPQPDPVGEAKALLEGLPKWLGPQQFIEFCRKTGDHKQADRFEAALATLTASQEQDSEVRP